MRGIEQVTLSYTFFSGYSSWGCGGVGRGICANRFSEARYDKNGHLSPMPAGM